MLIVVIFRFGSVSVRRASPATADDVEDDGIADDVEDGDDDVDDGEAND